MSALLEVRDVVKRFRVRGGTWLTALSGASFELEPGRALGIVGESGSGKSTLARCVVGLERPEEGSIRLDGVDLVPLTPRAWRPHRRRIQMVFQDPHGSLDPRQSVGAIVSEPLAIHGLGTRRERRARAIDLLESVGLSSAQAARYPHELSGGQRQRVAIARAIALAPDVLVCDEAVSALDVSIQAQIVELLRDLRQRLGTALVFIAHDLAVVRNLCDDVAVMYLGRIVESAPAAALFADPLHPYTRALLSAAPIPDPGRERARERIVLPGEPPSPLDPPRGCPFHPRCPERGQVADGRCEREIPVLSHPWRVNAPEKSRRTACHLHAPSVPERDP